MDQVDVRLGRKVRSAGQQIVTAITEAILDSRLPPGARLPSEEEMAERFGGQPPDDPARPCTSCAMPG